MYPYYPPLHPLHQRFTRRRPQPCQLFPPQILPQHLLDQQYLQAQEWQRQVEEAQAWRLRQQPPADADFHTLNEVEEVEGERDNRRNLNTPYEVEKVEDDYNQHSSDSPPKYIEDNPTPRSKQASTPLTIHHCLTCYNQHLDQGALDSWKEEDLGVEATEQLAKDKESLKDVDKMVRSRHKKNQACRVTICFCGALHLCPGWDDIRTEEHRL